MSKHVTITAESAAESVKALARLYAEEKQTSYTEFAKDSRQRKLLRKIIQEIVRHDPRKTLQFTTFSSEKITPQQQLNKMWEELGLKDRENAELMFFKRDIEECPRYRSIGQRLRHIRKERKLTIEEFSKILFSPLGELPCIEKELSFTPTRLRDMEYGILPFSKEQGSKSHLPEMIEAKFGVSEKWLMRGILPKAVVISKNLVPDPVVQMIFTAKMMKLRQEMDAANQAIAEIRLNFRETQQAREDT